MTLLDTDHLSVVADARDRSHGALIARLQRDAEQSLATAIVSVEARCRGWLGKIHRSNDVHEQVYGYERLKELFRLLVDWNIVSFGKEAADEFKRLKEVGVRIGTQDLNIAAIALVNNALLLSANLRDFNKVPGLRVQN